MNVLEINDEYDFSTIELEAPSSLTGGAYFTKFINKNNFKSIYLQLPKCSTKQGIVKNNTKTYTDLMFNSSEILLLKWLEEFESFCHKKIFEKKELWFHTDFTLNDIQEMMNPLTRLYKSGKYTILRTQIKNNKINIYDENENSLTLENLKNEDNVIPLIHINGIKFTSNNFTIDINLVQLMIVNEEEDLNNCIINIKPKQKKVENKLNLERSSNISKEFSNLEDQEDDLKDEKNILEDHEELERQQNNLEDQEDLEIEENKKNIIEDKENNNKNSIIDSLANNNNLYDEISDNKVFDKSIDNNLNIKEIDLDEILEEKDKIDLKDAEMVYYEIYKAARKKAKEIKKNAIEAYLEVKKIKNQYMLNDIDDSSESDIEELENNI
jgi:hypothetical protein